MPPIELSQEQVNNLARPIVGMVEKNSGFFQKPTKGKSVPRMVHQKVRSIP